MVFGALLSCCGFGHETKQEASKQESKTGTTAPVEYVYPNLYEEADEMLQNSLLIYTITDLRTMAKRKKTKLKNPERILELPLTLETALKTIEDNLELIQKEVGDTDHEMAMSALTSIQERYEHHTASRRWTTNAWTEQNLEPPYITKYGDDKPDKELVYAVGVDSLRKRVTVAFRGSVTPSDFVCDACISFSRRENPLKHIEGQENKIGLHHGFDEYLLKRRLRGSPNKYDEILQHVKELFQDEDRRQNYRLYVTGHSLGGALSTLFAMEVAAECLVDSSSVIPTPVTCVSVASPRVGDIGFQKAFRHLEKTGMLRHLRIANAGDPVAIMPKWSSKRIISILSPVSYVAFKLKDQDFAERETYRHTGIKLRLNNSENSNDDEVRLYELAYSGVTSAKEELEKDDEDVENDDLKAKNKKSWSVFSSMRDVPNVTKHFGTTYTHRLVKVKESLSSMTLNELYKTMANDS